MGKDWTMLRFLGPTRKVWIIAPRGRNWNGAPGGEVISGGGGLDEKIDNK